MGLLKHAVLPILALLHTVVVFQGLVLRNYSALIEMFDWPDKEDGREFTTWETHLLGILLGGHLGFLVCILYSIFMGNGALRVFIAWMEWFWWANGGYDAFRLGFPCAFANVLTVALTIGIIVHYNEPGIFTKDHNKDKTK